MDCDRCGKGFRPEIKYEAGALIFGIPMDNEYQKFPLTEKIHLCQPCWKDLKSWVVDYERPEQVFGDGN